MTTWLIEAGNRLEDVIKFLEYKERTCGDECIGWALEIATGKAEPPEWVKDGSR